MFHLVLGKRGSRLVKHQDAGVVGNGLGDLDHLPLGDGQIADDRAGVYIYIEALEHGLGVVVHLAGVDQTALGGEAAQPHVFHDVAAKHLVQLLMHHRHAVVQRVARAGEIDGLAVHQDFAAVARVDAKQALHQRGLARAVLTHQGVHRARPKFELRVVQRLDAGELLLDVDHFEQILFGHAEFSPLISKNAMESLHFKYGSGDQRQSPEPLCIRGSSAAQLDMSAYSTSSAVIFA